MCALYTDCGQHQCECSPGFGSLVDSSAGNVEADHVAPRSVERRAASEQTPPFASAHGPDVWLKAIRVPLPMPLLRLPLLMSVIH